MNIEFKFSDIEAYLTKRGIIGADVKKSTKKLEYRVATALRRNWPHATYTCNEGPDGFTTEIDGPIGDFGRVLGGIRWNVRQWAVDENWMPVIKGE